MRRSSKLLAALATLIPHLAAGQGPFDSTMFRTLDWRNIGPYRGGRTTTAVGVPANPRVYYSGATGGGLWKTDDAGLTWRNISDGFFDVGTIGDIAVYRGDPSIIYVGTGESPVRGQASSFGDGVYKSTDAGRTWTHIGLEKTRQIARVVVHPQDPNLVYVAAQGSRWAPTDDRGIYRSIDGGATWKRILFSAPSAGASELEMDPNNPRVLFAAFWDMQRTPWQLRSGGPGSGIWKSTDGGDTWARLSAGLPRGIMGKIRVAVSPASSNRVYAVVEAEDGGMYRSDDAGATWRRVSASRSIATRPWYYSGVTADPKNADVVYVMGAVIIKSTDGGVTYHEVQTPHSDQHTLWINPSNADNMVETNDGGTIVTFDGGATWSPSDNQPTGQFYAVQLDDLFPYNLYGGQQDHGSVSIASRAFGGAARGMPWKALGGGETARLAFDPKNPRVTFATNYLGIIERFDSENGARRIVSEWPAQNFGSPSDKMKLRFHWSAPLTTSFLDSHIMYHGGNVLFKSSDGGVHWTAISPDLTRNDPSHHGLSSVPFWNDGSGGEVYNTIFEIVESPHEHGTVWAGTDDGLVQLTRDGGKTWTNVTPKGLAEGWVTTIEVSPHNRATAYVAFNRIKWDDNTPHLFRTTDYGKTWVDIARTLPQDLPARVVREDPRRKNLLYAGTENAIWISFNGGTSWQAFQRNMPRVPISDLKIHNDDLVAATEGRAFWILDDLTLLQQLSDSSARARLFLFKPRAAYRITGGRGGGGANPPNGAVIRYSLGSALSPNDTLRLEILDGRGAIVRSVRVPSANATTSGGRGRGRGGAGASLTTNRGVNQFVWDFRSNPVASRDTTAVGSGWVVPSGTYAVRVTLGSVTTSQPLTVMSDPRTATTVAAEQEHAALARTLLERTAEINVVLADVRDARTQARTLLERAKTAQGAAVQRSLESFVATMDTLETTIVQTKGDNSMGAQDGINFPPGITAQFAYLVTQVDGTSGPVTQGERERAAELEREWMALNARIQRVLTADVQRINGLATAAGLAPITVRARSKP